MNLITCTYSSFCNSSIYMNIYIYIVYAYVCVRLFLGVIIPNASVLIHCVVTPKIISFFPADRVLGCFQFFSSTNSASSHVRNNVYVS